MAKYLLTTRTYPLRDGTIRSWKSVMREDELKQRLGVPAKLPRDFVLYPPVDVDGVLVYITKSQAPATPELNRWYKGCRHTAKHRVLAICPECNKVVSAARLAQHGRSHMGVK